MVVAARILTAPFGRAMVLVPTFIAAAATNIVIALIQSVTPSDNPVLNSADRLTLSIAAVAACGVLWRALTKKDDVVIKATETMTKALAQSAASNEELRKVIERGVDRDEQLIREIGSLRAGLSVLPCSDYPPQQRHRNIEEQPREARRASGSGTQPGF